jgi:lysozyme
MSELTYGIDVSHWTGQINYADIMTNGYGSKNLIPAFNFAKASEGKGNRDSLYSYHIAESRKVGLLTGAYHYYREAYDPSVQGKLFAQIWNDNGGTDLPPCLDVEIINNAKLTPKKVADCINEIEEHTKRKCMIYTGYYVWRDKMNAASFGKNYPLWIATYADAPKIPSPWTDWKFWQWSDSAGDENWFNGSLSYLRSFCGLSTNVETPASVETPWADMDWKARTDWLKTKVEGL